MNDTLIKVENVSKKFCRNLRKSLWYGMQDLSRELTGRSLGGNSDLRPEEFWAVKDVSFELKRGECLGLIGRNGAGKTTLLRMLNGLIKPDAGRIAIRGRTGALIALGAGFNPILTGRENIYVSASTLGLTSTEIKNNLDEIIEFAELGDAIDSPVQSYSSGMVVRLGFAISTSLEQPDIILLDEVLAVGDAAFRHKCYHRINKLLSHAAVIMVSHSMDYIAQISTTVAMMRHGAAEIFSEPSKGIAAYNLDNAYTNDKKKHTYERIEMVYAPVSRAQVCIINPDVHYGCCLNVEVEIHTTEIIFDVVFSFTALNFKEQPVMCWHTSRNQDQIDLRQGTQLLCFKIDPLLLHDGQYYWNFNMSRKGEIEHKIWFMRAGTITVRSEHRPLGDIPYIVDSTNFKII